MVPSGELVIYDVAKPAFAIREYLKYFRNLKEEDPSWLQLSNIALESFKETLDSLRTNSSAIGSDQFGFDLIS